MRKPDLKSECAIITFPDPHNQWDALPLTTHLGIGAHQDDLEILAIDGILKAYQNPSLYFTGTTITDGRSAPRSGAFRDVSDAEMVRIRNQEQREAAKIGKYLAQIQLNVTSTALKSTKTQTVIGDLRTLLLHTQPRVIYTHNLADKHDTHVTVAICVIRALREMNKAFRDTVQLYGCEVWRSLDWLDDAHKITFDTSNHQDLQRKLLGVFSSQMAGGKKYDQATMGRRMANATYFQSHQTDGVSGLVYAIDLTPLIQKPTTNISDFIGDHIHQFSKDVRMRLERSGAQ